MGLTVLDAGVLIGFLDASDAHHEAAHQALRDAAGRPDRLALPASAFAELLVAPSRKGPDATATVGKVIESIPIEIVALDAEIAARAAGVRARHRTLKLPDALVIATASHLHADHLVTTDRGWPTRSKLDLAVAIHVI